MIPAARQRVRVEGRAGLFFVLCVDQEHGCADLVELNSVTLVDVVPFERILPVHPEMGRNTRHRAHTHRRKRISRFAAY
jgi:hypothetical protein